MDACMHGKMGDKQQFSNILWNIVFLSWNKKGDLEEEVLCSRSDLQLHWVVWKVAAHTNIRYTCYLISVKVSFRNNILNIKRNAHNDYAELI